MMMISYLPHDIITHHTWMSANFQLQLNAQKFIKFRLYVFKQNYAPTWLHQQIL